MSKLKLTVNDSKTRVCRLPEEKFDFLGYTFGRCYSPQNWPSLPWHAFQREKRVHRICGEITRNDRTEYNLAGSSDNCNEAQPHDVRMGELLLSWTGQYGLSCRR